MHDIDRTEMEYGYEMPQAGFETGYETGFEAEQFEYPMQEYAGGQGEFFPQEYEMELAQELLTVNSEAELDQFLGKLIRSAGQVVNRAVNSSAGQAIGGALKTAARQALTAGGKAGGESLGGAAGSWGGAKLGAWAGNKLGNLTGQQGWGDKGRALGGQWGQQLGTTLGGKIGSGVGNWAANKLGLEMESMGPEEFEFAGAQQFIRMAGDIARRTLAARGPNLQAAARAAALAAARQYAPGLLGGARPQAEVFEGSTNLQQGRWVRQGNKIIVYGI